MEMKLITEWLQRGEALYHAGCDSCREMEQQIEAMKASLAERAAELEAVGHLLGRGTRNNDAPAARSILFAPADDRVRPVARVSDAEVMRAFVAPPTGRSAH